MALPTLDATFASSVDLPRRQMLAKWLVEELGSGSIADYYDLPERYLWAKIAVAAGAPRPEADYISLPKNYVWSDIYNAVSGSNSYIPIVDPNLALNVAQNSNGNRQGAWYNKVTLTVAEGELVNVESLRFTFLEPVYFAPTDGANSTMLATGYREIDVFGTPSPLPPPLQAELTYENNWNYIAPSGVTLSGTNYFASTNDLANAGQPTLASTVWSGGSSGSFGSSPAQLNNGLYAAAELTGGVPSGFVDVNSTETTLLATPNSTYTINFNGGVDITSVNVYAAMTGTERSKQNWKLEYKTAGSGTIDWSENVALGHIAAAYRGDTGNPANLATYIDWPWRYKVASIITSL